MQVTRSNGSPPRTCRHCPHCLAAHVTINRAEAWRRIWSPSRHHRAQTSFVHQRAHATFVPSAPAMLAAQADATMRTTSPLATGIAVGSRSRCCLQRVPDLSRTRCCLLPVRCCLPLRRMRSVDCCAQCAANAPLLTPRSCVWDALRCMATTHRCNAQGCDALVCDQCASNMCPPGGNENEYHWCPTHWEHRAEAEGENEGCESDEDSNPFAFRPT